MGDCQSEKLVRTPCKRAYYSILLFFNLVLVTTVFAQSDLDNDGIPDQEDPETIVATNAFLEAGTYTFKNLIIAANSTLVLKSNLSLEGFKGVTINADNLTIDETSRLSADGTGYPSDQGPGAGLTGGTGGSGGGYGGKGGGVSTPGGPSYGSSTTPTDLGSGGGWASWYGTKGGSGGGAIRLIVQDSLTNNGNITTNGGNGLFGISSNSGGGSGGSIHITTNKLQGTGHITANGGTGGGGGGGGRIAAYYQTTNTPTQNIQAKGGKGVLDIYDGQDGTVVLDISSGNLPPPPNQPPNCAIELRKDGNRIDTINAGDFFDIYVGGSTDDTEIKEVRFSSDEERDGIPTGSWTQEYNWVSSLGDWNASSKIKRWAFATEGTKEVWAEIKDNNEQTTNCSADITSENSITIFSDNFSSDSGRWTYVDKFVHGEGGYKYYYPGSAYRDPANEYLVLTQNMQTQAGIVWFDQDIFSSFTLEFRYKAGGGTGADGLAVMFYKKKDYEPFDGGTLGFVSAPEGPRIEYLTNVPGYGVEFDNWANGDYNDPSANHIALIKDSMNNHLTYANDARTEDNTWHNVKIIVGTSTIKVYVDNSLVLDWAGTINRTYGGIGFSGATGMATNWHIIDDVKISIPSEPQPSAYPPNKILSPVVGPLEVVTNNIACSGLNWCFEQTRSGNHAKCGVGCANDTLAWDANLNYPAWDSDDSKEVYAVDTGTVAATYGEAINANNDYGNYGQVLIEHEYNGRKWWSGYLHLKDIRVSPGNNVTRNTVIGNISHTSKDSIPNHLHFVVYTGSNAYGKLISFNATIVERTPRNTAKGEELSQKIRDRLKQKIVYPPYLLKAESFESTISTVWLDFTSWLTQTELTERYDLFYQSGINFDILRVHALIKARNFLNEGDLTNTERYLQKADTYLKLSDMSFDAASQVFLGNSDAAETIAHGIKEGSQYSVIFGAKFVSPITAQAADYLFIAIDYAVDQSLSGINEAVRNAAKSLIIKGIFEGVAYAHLGGNTIEGYTENFVDNRVGKYLFPTLEETISSQEGQFALSKIIKASIAELGIDTEERALQGILNYGLEESKKIIGAGSYKIIKLNSPGEVRIYDNKGRVTGLIQGKIKEEIPDSVYDADTETVIILIANDTYYYEVVGIDTGTYGLDIFSVKGRNQHTVILKDIPIAPNVTHRYVIGLDNSSKSEKEITIGKDIEGDGIFEETVETLLPTAYFMYLPKKIFVNQSVLFNASSSEGNALFYNWEFGDIKNGIGETVNHSYSLEGDYAVTLVVKDASGIVDKKTKIIQVIADTISPITNITLTGDVGKNNWYVSNVWVNLNATDNEGGWGVDRTEYGFDGTNWGNYTEPLLLTSEGAMTIYYRSFDKAGNVEEAKNRTINIDKTQPQITGAATTQPNANGWYNSNVTIRFQCEDLISGPVMPFFDASLALEGANQSANGTCRDNAGNSANFTVGGINIDKTPPLIGISTPENGSEYLLNENVPADWLATDALSGIASAGGTASAGEHIDTHTVGVNTFWINAVDNAGNQITQESRYYVRYAYSGILRPINADNASTFKLGGTIPVKFRLQDAAGNVIANATAKIYVAKIGNNTIGAESEAVSTSAATTGNLFRYDGMEGQYIFNFATRTMSPGNWQLRISLDDGTSKYARIFLR